MTLLSFEHRHYKFIADTIANMRLFEKGEQKIVAHVFANKLDKADESGKFDRVRFHEACGIPRDEQWPRSFNQEDKETI